MITAEGAYQFVLTHPHNPQGTGCDEEHREKNKKEEQEHS